MFSYSSGDEGECVKCFSGDERGSRMNVIIILLMLVCVNCFY